MSTFSAAASMNRLVSFDMSSSLSAAAAPKSTRPIVPASSRMRMFAGCGSAWMNPWRKIIVIHVSATRYARSRRSSSDSGSVSTSASCVPSIHSSVSTRAREYCQYTFGMCTFRLPAKLRWNVCAWRPSSR